MVSISAEVMGMSSGRSITTLGNAVARLATGVRRYSARNGFDARGLRRFSPVEYRVCVPRMARDYARQFTCVAGSPAEEQQIG
jgi:hypothetical protein